MHPSFKLFVTKFSIRFQLVLILLGVVAYGAGASHLLLSLGLTSVVLRHLAVMISSYLFFFVLIRLWLEYVRLNARVFHEVVGQSKLIRPCEAPVTKKLGSEVWEFSFLDFCSGEFWLGVTVVALLSGVIIFFIGIEGPALLIDAAFEVALSLGMVQGFKKMNQANWCWRVLERTIFPFLIILFASTATLFFADRSCPGKSRFSEIVRQCWLHRAL